MKHPNMVRKIRELMGISFSHHSPSQSSRGEPSPEAVAYITAVFYETIRLYPPIPFEIKQAQSDVLLPDGTLLPSKSIVVWCTWAMNRSKDTWGEDAAEFRPERWLVDGRMRYREAAEFPVFQGGPRLCLGKKMAEMVAVQVILELVSLFNFSPAYEGEKVSRNHLTLPMEGGLSVYVEKL
jgi:cytochrome P450